MSLSKILNVVFHSRKIQDRFTFIFTFIVVFAGVVFFFISSYVRKRMFYSDELENSKRQVINFQFRIKKEAEKNLALATLFSKNFIVEKAYKIAYQGNINNPSDKYSAKARVYLRKNMKPMLRAYYKKTGSKLKLHYHLPPARSLVRLWRNKQVRVNGKWKDISDDISSFRSSILDISSGRKEIIKGIEIGRGGFAIRGITSIKSKNKIIGSAEVLSSFKNLVGDFQKEFGYSVSIFMDGKFINIAHKLKKNKKIIVNKNRTFYTVFSSNSKLNNTLIKANELLRIKSKIVNRYYNNYKITYFPIFSYNKKLIGVGVFLHNIDKSLSEMFSFKMGILILIALVVLATLLVSFFLGRSVGNKFKIVQSLISDIARGKLNTSYTPKKVNCSKILGCEVSDCPLNQQEVSDCFIRVGSLAPIFGNEISCPSITKGRIKDCRKCKVMREIAPGELTELIAIAHYTTTRLHSLMKSVKEMINKVSSKARELSTSSESLLGNVQSQSASMEEVAATMEEMNESVKNISKFAEDQFTKVDTINKEFTEVNNKTLEAGQEVEVAVKEVEVTVARANKGEDIVRDTVDSMKKIKESTNSILETIAVISGISAQVDLLSLNASIEAARAGEHGRGFAVVANEISKLSDNTAKSAAEITDLIASGNEETENGMKMVNKMQEDFSSIQNSISEIGKTIINVGSNSTEISNTFSHFLQEIDEVNKLANHIFSVSREQLNATNEVALTIENISAKTQDITRETSSLDEIFHDLAETADTLDKKIQYFKI